MKLLWAIRPIFFVFALLCFALVACNHDSKPATAYKPVFISDTLKNNTLLLGFPSFSYSETAEPLVRYLNARLSGIHVKMKACVSFDEYVDYLNHNKFDFTLINGIQAVDASNKGYSIIGKVIDDDKYAGVIFIRKDAGIKKITDLKGKTVALFPSKTVPGTMMPLYYLYQNGLNVNSDIIRVNVSSFESAIIATYIDKSKAGMCLKRSWDVYIKNHPEILSKVEVKWQTPVLINNALLIKNSMDTAVSAQLMNLLFSMQTTMDGKAALNKLQFTGFKKADQGTYKPMIDFKRRYDAVIH